MRNILHPDSGRGKYVRDPGGRWKGHYDLSLLPPKKEQPWLNLWLGPYAFKRIIGTGPFDIDFFVPEGIFIL